MAKSKKIGVMEMVDLVFKAGYIDDQFGTECECEFLGIIMDPWKDKIYVVPLAEITTLNPLYYDEEEGTIHLSKRNTMGRFDAGVTSNTVGSMESMLQNGVERFNRENVFKHSVERHSYFQAMQLISKEDWMAAKNKGGK
jgi:hypothetical protein